jgi:MFS family permease
MAPFSTAFGGFLLSLVLWQEGVWHWPAMKIGLAIEPGPFMVPVTSLLLAGPLIARFGAAAVVAAGLIVFAAGVIVWAVLAGPEADLGFAVLCVIPLGIGVGLTLPTLMGIGTSALPASSFATGSGVINMVRQIGFAVGVAIFVAIVGRRLAGGSHGGVSSRLVGDGGDHRAWPAAPAPAAAVEARPRRHGTHASWPDSILRPRPAAAQPLGAARREAALLRTTHTVIAA